MEDLEKFIKKNSSELKSTFPEKTSLWDKINQELDRPEVKVIPLWKKTFKWAAVLLILLGLGSLIRIAFLNQDIWINSNSDISIELKDIDTHYQSLVSSQVALLINHPKLSESSRKEYLSFLDELDAEYMVLRKELDKGLDNEIVLEAIISNYKKRIELIQKLLILLDDSNLKEDDDAYTF